MDVHKKKISHVIREWLFGPAQSKNPRTLKKQHAREPGDLQHAVVFQSGSAAHLRFSPKSAGASGAYLPGNDLESLAAVVD